MTILNDRPTTTTGPGDFGPSPVSSARKQSLGKAVVNWITSTDHKVIGYMYLVTSMVWFLIAGLMALAMRAELAIPGMQLVSLEQYNSCSPFTARSCCSCLQHRFSLDSAM